MLTKHEVDCLQRAKRALSDAAHAQGGFMLCDYGIVDAYIAITNLLADVVETAKPSTVEGEEG